MLKPIMGGRVAVVVELPNEHCFVRADLSQFETALVNMAVNARDAMDGEGTLTLSLSVSQPMPAIRGHAAIHDAYAAVSLTDTGAGIAPEVVSRIFEPFFTTKDVGKGTGLGLSQVFGFAKQSGGNVDVRSLAAHGTTFTLYLPQVDRVADPETDLEEEEAPILRGAGRRVLVVEDNSDIGRFTTQTLQDLGYMATWVTNAAAALERLAGDPGAFDVVFSDVVMPGMNGVDLGQEINRYYPSLPVILTSGYSDVLAKEVSHGFELLHKPYSVEQLSRILRYVTRRRRARSASPK
jgi:CheY-like chemotaxis protein